VLPFSKRPPPPEEYRLRSGDFEPVQSPRHQVASYGQPHAVHQQHGAPQAARASLFVRQAQSNPHGYAQHQRQQRRAYGRAELSAPPPPHSLAPVAMASELSLSNRNRPVTATGNARLQGTVVIRETSSLKWRVMIMASGILLGGVLGLGADARRQAARAAAASAVRDVAPPVLVAAASPQAPQAAVVAPAARPAAGASRAATPPVLHAPVAANPPALAPPVVAIAPSAAVVVSSPTTPKQAAPQVRHAVAPPPAVRPTSSVAAKVLPPKPEPVAKAEPAPKREASRAGKPAREDTKAAQDLLEQANKDTVNTL